MKKYSQEFKEEAVKLVMEQGYTMSQAAKSLGVRANMIWRRKYISEGRKVFDASSQQDELRRLREELKQVQMERDILIKAAAFFAKELN